MALLLVFITCRKASFLPLALIAFVLSRKVAALSGAGPSLSDSEAYALLQAFFHPQLALFSLIFSVLIVGALKGRVWLPFSALVGLTAPDLGSLSVFNGPSSGLLNGLVLIHPPLLFFGYACLAVQTLDLPSLKTRLLLSRSPHALAVLALVTFLFALMLGSIWAQHELNWGGWWGWDLVELGSLFFLLLAWGLTHQPAWAYGPSRLTRQSFSFFFLFYLGLRFGLFESVHSFVGPTSKLPAHVPLAYALPLLFFFRPSFYCSRHLLGFGLSLGLSLIWLRAGVDPLGSSLHLIPVPSIAQVTLLLFAAGASLLPHHGGLWGFYGWVPFFSSIFGIRWFSFLRPRVLHTAAALAILGLPLLKLAPVQLSSLFSPLVDMLLIGPSSWTSAVTPSIQTFNFLTWSSPLSFRGDFSVQPGFHPALGALVSAGGTWAHVALVKNFLTILSLQALGAIYIVPSFYLIFSLGLVKKHQNQQK